MKINKTEPPVTAKHELISSLSQDKKNVAYAKKLANADNRGVILKGIITTAAVACAAIVVMTTALVGRELLHGDMQLAGSSADNNYIIINGQLVGASTKNGFVTNGEDGRSFTFAEIFANDGFYNGSYKITEVGIDDSSVDREILSTVSKYSTGIADGVDGDGNGIGWDMFEFSTRFEEADNSISVPVGTSFSFFTSGDKEMMSFAYTSKKTTAVAEVADDVSKALSEKYASLSVDEYIILGCQDFDGDGKYETAVYSENGGHRAISIYSDVDGVLTEVISYKYFIQLSTLVGKNHVYLNGGFAGLCEGSYFYGGYYSQPLSFAELLAVNQLYDRNGNEINEIFISLPEYQQSFKDRLAEYAAGDMNGYYKFELPTVLSEMDSDMTLSGDEVFAFDATEINGELSRSHTIVTSQRSNETLNAVTATDADKLNVETAVREGCLGEFEVNITDVYEVDADGDGTFERVICASTPESGYDKNKYSVILLVKQGRASKTVVSWFDGQDSVMETFELFGAMDLNHDGGMELIVNSSNEWCYVYTMIDNGSVYETNIGA